VILGLAASAYAADPLVFIGGTGIHAFRFQTKPGKLIPLGQAVETTNPTFLVQHQGYLYAVNRNGSAQQMGSVSAFAVDAQAGKLKLLNWVSSRGGAPCHLAVDRTGRWLAVANCAGGSIAVLPIRPDGRLADAVAYSKTGGEPQSIAFAPDNRSLAAAYGAIGIYSFDASTGAIAAKFATKDSGYHHIAFHPEGRALYALTEANSSVTVFQYGESDLDPIQNATTLPGFTKKNTATALLVNPAGTVLYAANEGHDSIYAYGIDPNRLTLVPAGDFPSLGENPTQMAVDPTGDFLLVANQTTNDLAVFKIQAKNGQFTPAGKLTKVEKPTCILFWAER
jgi:6-phosphogluconolactonase